MRRREARKSPFSSTVSEKVFKSVIDENAFKRVVESKPSPEEVVEYIRERRKRIGCGEAEPGELAEAGLEEEFEEAEEK